MSIALIHAHHGATARSQSQKEAQPPPVFHARNVLDDPHQKGPRRTHPTRVRPPVVSLEPLSQIPRGRRAECVMPGPSDKRRETGSIQQPASTGLRHIPGYTENQIANQLILRQVLPTSARFNIRMNARARSFGYTRAPSNHCWVTR